MRDIRYGFRSLRRAPAFTAAAVTTLALASAAVVGVFSLVNAALLRPLPYRDPSGIVLCGACRPMDRGPGCHYPKSTICRATPDRSAG
jgi:hypothetical protein